MTINLNYHIQGQGFPIICLHGHPGAASSMAIFTDHLSQKYQTIAPDLRGYGKSRCFGDFAMTDHLSDLETLLNHLKIDKCILMGWSLGGILSLELALKLPQRITGLILVASAARPWGNHPAISWQDNLYTGIAAILNYVKPGWQWNIETFGKRSLFRYLIQQHTKTTYQHISQAAIPAYLQTSPHATKALYNAIKLGYNRLPHIDQIKCPSLMLAGEQDRHITAQCSLETAQKLQNAQWQCYPHTAHLFPWEIPKQVLTDIDQWLDIVIDN